MWFRVFGTDSQEPSTEFLRKLLGSDRVQVTVQKDHQGWFSMSVRLEAGSPSLELNRFLTTEDSVRPELNSWAAWLETQEDQPNHARLMLQVIRTTQLFTLCLPEPLAADGALRDLCLRICQQLSRESDGFYQADGLGFFDPDGNCLLKEPVGEATDDRI